MKALKGRTAIARGVIIFSAIVLALAVVLPVLADGPNGNGGKPNKSENSGQPAGGGQSGEPNPGEAGQVKALPDQASSQGNQGQGRSDQTGSRGNQGQGKAQPDKAGSRDIQGQGRSDQAGSRGNQGQGKAHPDKASSPGNQGQSKAHPDRAGSQDVPGQGRSDQAGSRGNQGQGKAHPDRVGSQDVQGQGRSDQAGSKGNKGKSKRDPASSLPSLGQAQGMTQSKQGVEPDKPGLAHTDTGRSGVQADQAPGPGAAFTQTNNTCNLYRSRGKPGSVTFAFSDITQGGSVISISNTGGLKNLRITVNGQRFQVHLDNGATQTMIDLDVSSALLTSDSNSIEFTPLGKPGTCAMVLLR